MEKKLARLEGARGAEIADLQSELEVLRGTAKEQLKEKEGRINSLVEELSKTQSLLSEKETELEGVSAYSLFCPRSPDLLKDPDRSLVVHEVPLDLKKPVNITLSTVWR